MPMEKRGLTINNSVEESRCPRFTCHKHWSSSSFITITIITGPTTIALMLLMMTHS